MEENVHKFVTGTTAIDALPNNRRETGPYDANGSSAKAFGASLVQKNKRDVAEPKMEENVHKFVTGTTAIDALPNLRREASPYDPNGSSDSAFQPSLFQKNKKDIGEKKIDEEVHGFVKDNIDVLPNLRRAGDEGYDYNGSGPLAHKDTLVQKSAGDIANKEVRPDVYDVVSKNVNPTPLWRSDVAPEQRKDGLFKYDGQSAYNTLAETEPEGVHVLEPIAYQHRANTNTPNMRTTFYDKKNMLWREGEAFE
mmetsp:Transcript_13459/g.22896  ORF Transcript_13459/g.22896 Transcript_13459/m.22896 type:complete len:252 (-) Transcript_13459:43-798(-)